MWLNKLFRCQTSFHFNPDSFHQFQQIWREKMQNLVLDYFWRETQDMDQEKREHASVDELPGIEMNQTHSKLKSALKLVFRAH